MRLWLRWRGTDAAPSSGIARYRVVLKVRRHHHVRTVWVRHYAAAGDLERHARTHRAYRLIVVAADAAGNRSVRDRTPWIRR